MLLIKRLFGFHDLVGYKMPSMKKKKLKSQINNKNMLIFAYVKQKIALKFTITDFQILDMIIFVIFYMTFLVNMILLVVKCRKC